MTLHRFLAVFTLVLVIVTGVVLWFVPSNEDFGLGNPFWNGSRSLSDEVRIIPLGSFPELPSSPRGTTLIFVPYRQCDTRELEILGRFVLDGGTLLLADDFGYGNQVLQYLGIGERFSGQALLDPVFHYKSRWFPLVDCDSGDYLTVGLDNLTLNHATALVGVKPASVLATSSSFSFLDGNGNEVADGDEPVGRQVVMSRQTLGQGRIILFSDPSIFISSMLTFDGSIRLVKNIAEASPAGLYFDQSHLVTSNLYQAKEGMRTLRDLAVKPPVAVALALGILAVTLVPVWHSGAKKKG